MLTIQSHSPIFPDGLIEETLDMLALPFPESDRKVRRRLLEKQRANSTQTAVDSASTQCGNFRPGYPFRRLRRFQFWRDRLVLLEEAVANLQGVAKSAER